MGEYSNVAQEELIEWINAGGVPPGPEGAMAGPMPVMANLLLSTGRPIINHPHYEVCTTAVVWGYIVRATS